MERKSFIKNSVVFSAVAAFSPVIAKALVPSNQLRKVQLKENIQIRHGFYAPQTTLNEIGLPEIKSVNIDRFLNPDGDLLLYDVRLNSQNIRIAINGQTVLISDDSLTTEKQVSQRGNAEIWTDHKGLHLIASGNQDIRLQGKCLLLQGKMYNDTNEITSPALFYYADNMLAQFQGENAIVLIIREEVT